MAISITLNLDDTAEAVLNALTAEYNKTVLPPDSPLTPTQYLLRAARELLKAQGAKLEEQKQASLRAAYRVATPEEQAAISAILDKYR